MSTNKLEKLVVKKKQIEVQIRLHRNREKAQARKQDTRRKILIGAAILSQIKKKKFSKKQLNEILNSELSYDRDKRLFGLESDSINES